MLFQASRKKSVDLPRDQWVGDIDLDEIDVGEFQGNIVLEAMDNDLESTAWPDGKYRPCRSRRNVDERRKPMNKKRVARLAIRMAKALRHIHSKGVAHLDGHLKNWMFKGEELMLIDFDSARTICR